MFRLLLAFAVLPVLFATIPIRVVDGQGNRIEGARIEVLSPSANVIYSGPPEVPDDAPRGSRIRVHAPGFADAVVTLSEDLTVTLDPAREMTSITVTAMPGLAEELSSRPEMALIGTAPQRPTVAHALEAQPNVMLQQTGAGQVSPFLRGLTGYQVLNLVDGVRFNNSTFRSGPNQYLAYLEPSQASHVEAVLGPSGTAYGSDALGGTIQVLTAQPRFGSDAWHGDLSVSGETADLSAGTAGSISYGREKLWLMAGGAGRRHNDLRAGGGRDSHNVLTRLFGYSPDQVRATLGSRQRDTAYSHGGAHGKAAIRIDERQILTAWYQRGEVRGLRNTKDLWGGLGRLQSTLDPQIVDLFYTRYERLAIAGFDSLSGRFSFNRQQDGGVRQGLRATDAITTEHNRVRSLGYSGQGITHLGSHTALSAGGELYDEHVRSSRAVNGATVRPLYPTGSEYRIGGLFAQAATEWRRLRAGYGLRFTRVSFRNPAAPQFQTPESTQSFSDWTWNGSLLYRLNSSMAVHAMGSRGFRAPNLNDLGAIGLQDLGYEVPSREVPGALLADSAGEAALSKGVALRPLGVETLRDLEAGIRWQSQRKQVRLQFFDAQLEDPIVRRTLLFPAGSAPTSIAGLAVTPVVQTAAQRAQGVVAVASAVDPRALKTFVNDGRARYWGTEAIWEQRIGSHWFWRSSYSFLLGRDLDPNRNIRRLPPQQGTGVIRYSVTRFWVEGQIRAAGAQDRLSGGDRDDERIGASRRRIDIADFYNSAKGASVRGSETLQQIQDRVLPGIPDATRVTLYESTPGWVALDARAGFPLGEWMSVEAALTNFADRNYRIHGSGIDAPGRSAFVQLKWRF